MFDLKVINSVLDQLEEERGVPKAKVIEAIEFALASAYKKEYGKRGQIIDTNFNIDTGETEFFQIKIVVDPENLLDEDEEASGLVEAPVEGEEEDPKIRFDEEKHIMPNEARLIKTDSQIGDEITFPLESKGDFGRIASQTAKQVIMQKIREAEKVSVMNEYGEHEGEIVSGTVQRMERGAIFLDIGRAVGYLAYEEQIPGERFKQGERVRAYLYKVEESTRGIFLKLSRSHPKFLEQLFFAEVPELTQEVVEVKAIAREAGARSKIAVYSNDQHVDPVGALVGQRGVRVNTIMSELGGEKIDVIEWSEDPKEFIEEALSPAQILEVETNEEGKVATVKVSPDQQSLAIGKGGQNARLAAKLTGWKIDVQSLGGEEEKESLDEAQGEAEISEKSTGNEPKEEIIESEAVSDAETPVVEEKVETEEETKG
jgi:transcription termination/antitermination protein NusA